MGPETWVWRSLSESGLKEGKGEKKERLNMGHWIKRQERLTQYSGNQPVKG